MNFVNQNLICMYVSIFNALCTRENYTGIIFLKEGRKGFLRFFGKFWYLEFSIDFLR